MPYAPYIASIHTILTSDMGKVTVHKMGQRWAQEALARAMHLGEMVYEHAQAGKHIGIVPHCTFGRKDTLRYTDTTEHIACHAG